MYIMTLSYHIEMTERQCWIECCWAHLFLIFFRFFFVLFKWMTEMSHLNNWGRHMCAAYTKMVINLSALRCIPKNMQAFISTNDNYKNSTQNSHMTMRPVSLYLIKLLYAFSSICAIYVLCICGNNFLLFVVSAGIFDENGREKNDNSW